MELQRNDPSMAGPAEGRPRASNNGLAPKPSEVFAAVEQRTQTLANYVVPRIVSLRGASHSLHGPTVDRSAS